MKDFEDDDPMELQGILIPGGDLEAQAAIVIDEFLSIGATKEDLLAMFTNPSYGGAFHLYRQLGAEKIRGLIAGRR
jgi:hypothetical protein